MKHKHNWQPVEVIEANPDYIRVVFVCYPCSSFVERQLTEEIAQIINKKVLVKKI